MLRPAWRERIGFAGIALGILLATLIVASFSGILVPVTVPAAYLATFR